jgi:hypothetical protein
MDELVSSASCRVRYATNDTRRSRSPVPNTAQLDIYDAGAICAR